MSVAMFFPLFLPLFKAASGPEQPARRKAGLLLGAAVVVALTGCAGPALLSGEGPAFERAGRFAVNVTEAGGSPDAVQGGFSWRDTGQHLRLDLVNPLGSTLARISVDGMGAVLEQADGKTERAADADALLARVVGTALPVSNLRDWLQGRAGSGPTHDMERDGAGRPLSFGQDGWQVQMSRYDAAGPGLLRLERRDGARRISVRLAVDAQASQ